MTLQGLHALLAGIAGDLSLAIVRGKRPDDETILGWIASMERAVAFLKTRVGT